LRRIEDSAERAPGPLYNWPVRLLISIVLAVAGLTAQDFPALPVSHVTVATSSAVAAHGKGVSLFVDVTPKPKIHVYAPGAADYQPIKLTIDPQPGLTVGELHYPKSTLLVNDVEKVPVYDKRFRLVQDVSVPAKSATVTVKGRIEYQACDDAVCYKPASIPVSWTVSVK
jgi:DsbC/DsbD-like thiol-disulfide interchange protein